MAILLLDTTVIVDAINGKKQRPPANHKPPRLGVVGERPEES